MAFSKPKLKVTFAEDLGFEVVDVYVGPERKRYVVHKNLLVRQSDYFKGALAGSFIEAEENSIHLKEEDPAAVALLIGWLYHGAIPGTENLTNPFGPFVTSMFSSPQPTQIPISEMGTIYPFNPSPAPTNNGPPHHLDMFQHICHQSHYTVFSPEELRLADYKLNRKYNSDEPFIAPPSQPTASGGLFGNSGDGFSLFAQPASQPTVPQATGPGLFGGNSLSSPVTSPPFTSQAPAFGLFSQPASQPSASQASSSARLAAQIDPTQSTPFASFLQPNMFASRYGPITSAPSSNSSGMDHASQSQSLFHGASTSMSGPQYFGFMTSAHPSTHNLSHGVNNSTSGGLFGSAATSNRSPNPFSVLDGFGGSASTANATSNIFAGSGNPVSQEPSVSDPALLFGTAASSTTSNGVLAGGVPRALFGGAPNHSQTFNDFRAQHQTSNQAVSLPPGATMMTITPHKPKLGEFGSYSSIKHTKSPGLVIPGIPQANPQNEQYVDVEKQQLGLLNLCIMAETFCWPSLFNDAINAYIRGEHRLQRSIPLDFMDRIYVRTHDDSTLRGYALDSLCQMRAEGIEDLTPYMELAQKHQDFLADLLGKVLGSSSPSDFNDKTLENYKYGMGQEEVML